MVTGMVQHHIGSMSFCINLFNQREYIGTGWGMYWYIGGNYEHNTCTYKQKV